MAGLFRFAEAGEIFSFKLVQVRNQDALFSWESAVFSGKPLSEGFDRFIWCSVFSYAEGIAKFTGPAHADRIWRESPAFVLLR